ncbi:ankyrin repeat domain-containing protein [Viridibacillus sp. NPDC096237]|uniref:ankyrin repeat domain-containing protein n=1 Tax=Viridibacillus sp. NPDC096237 TaxID=3390721 RepID=UPI003D089750
MGMRNKAIFAAVSLGLAFAGYMTMKKARVQMSLFEAVEKQDVNAVKKALKSEQSINTQDSKGRTALMLATYNNDVKSAKVLIEAGADVNIQDDMQNSPFLYAGAEGYLDIVKLTTKAGADPKLTNRYGGIALIPASEHGYVDVVKFLLTETNSDVNHINNLGWTALLEAIILGDGGKKQQETVRVLLEYGANPNLADRDGVTPLEHAEKLGFKEIENLIRKARY